MKKNISINIGGIIFHIEEDGFDRLKAYLDSINKYFESFEDSKEIIDDIENRIAEIFLGKLSDGNQVITIVEIDELITTMGTIADFEATIESEPTIKEEVHEEQTETADSTSEEKQTASKRLYRDAKHRVLGGVASGIAHYFNIDPLWIRLLFLVLFFNILFIGVSGATLLAYIILWIVLPPSDELEEDKGVKKLFRNPEDRVLGGVSSGIAAYFGTDITVIRLLFVLSIFLGGAGIILYIILWIITPEAKTITEKMQMQGEPVTLSNIETNIKKSFKVEEGEENVFVKILLFPFRLIALIINGLAQVLGPLLKFLIELFRIAFGALLSITGFLMVISFLIIFFVIIGVQGNWTEYVYLDQLPIDLFVNSIGWIAATSILLVVLIPAIALILLGVIIIAKRAVGNAYLGWSLFGLWILGLIGASFSIPSIARDFRVENDYREERTFTATSGIPTLRLGENLSYGDYDGVNLRLRGHSDSTYKLVLRTESRGSTRGDAEDNARAVSYTVKQEGGDFIFDPEIDFTGASFRFQEVNAIFYIPFGQTFRMEYELKDILTNTLYLDGYRAYQMEGNDWIFERSGLQCITCENEEDDVSDRRSRRSRSRIYQGPDDESIPFDVENFTSVKIASSFKVSIVEDDEYRIEIRGDDRDDANLTFIGDEVEIKYRDDWDWWENNVGRDLDLFVYITAPELESVELIGGCEGEMEGFNTREIEIKLVGASELEADIDPRYLDIELVGASKLVVEGSGDEINAKVMGASRLDAFDFRSEKADIRALGASKVEVFATEEIDIEASGVSTVRYRGTDRVRIDSDGLSTVRRN